MSNICKNEKGFAFVYVVVGIALTAMLSVIGYSSYYGIVKGSSQATAKTLSGNYLIQGAYMLSTESSDTDGDGFYEAPAMKTAAPSPAGGGQIPDTSGATKTDSWGTSIGYCSWDHGSINSSAGRITGNNPGSMSDKVFVVISAGPDKTFNTSCADISSGAGVKGDDGARWAAASQIRQGVGGTVYYGDPVADLAALNALSAGSLKDGELRLTKDTNKIYRWNSGSETWVEVSGGGGGSSIWTEDAVNNTVYLTNTGRNVGIGITNPIVEGTGLHIAGTGSAPAILRLEGKNTAAGKWEIQSTSFNGTRIINFRDVTGGVDFVAISPTGVGIGTLDPAGYRLNVNGPMYAASYAGSDKRLKKNIAPIQSALNKALKLTGVNFEWRQDEFKERNFEKGKQIGFIAQDVEKIIPEVVKTDTQGYKAIAYEKLTAVLAEAIKEQQQQIEELKSGTNTPMDVERLKLQIAEHVATLYIIVAVLAAAQIAVITYLVRMCMRTRSRKEVL